MFAIFSRVVAVCSVILVCAAAGAAAPSPNDGFSPDAKPALLALQNDGKIVMGEFSKTGFSDARCNRVGRLFPDGTRDTAYINAVTSGSNISCLAVQPDGKLLVGGWLFIDNQNWNSYGLLRMNTDGSLDAGFQSQHVVAAGVSAVAVQPDGKILVIDRLWGNPYYRPHISRIKPNGSLDASFPDMFDAGYELKSLVLLPSGKFCVGGSHLVGGTKRFYVARFNPDGNVDTTFNFPFSETAGSVAKIFVQPNGKLLLNVTNSSMRLNEDGSQDMTFHVDGLYPTVMDVQPDGKILVYRGWQAAGDWRFGISRHNQDGSLDPTFRTPFAGAYGFLNSAKIQADGKLIASFGDTYRPLNLVLYRFNIDGSLDDHFNSGLKTDGAVKELEVQADGKIVLLGDMITNVNGTERAQIARLDAKGSLDPGFDPAKATDGAIRSIAVQGDNKVLAGGSFHHVGGLARDHAARFNQDGSVDPVFNPNLSDDVFRIEALASGKSLVNGSFFPYLNRLNANGSIDNTFSTSGDAFYFCMALQPDEKILMESADREISRLNADGTADAAFNLNANGVLEGTLGQIAVQDDGKILFTSYSIVTTIPSFTTPTTLKRLNADGTLDTSFTAMVTELPGQSGMVYAMTPIAGGKTLVGGNFSIANNAPHPNLVRVNNDGSLDDTFNPSGAGPNGTVYSIRKLDGGKILIGGDFTEYNGIPRCHVARLNADGSLDSNADFLASGPDAPVVALATNADGSVMIGGEFQKVNHVSRAGAARLDMDGWVDTTFTASALPVSAIAAQPDGSAFICERMNDVPLAYRMRLVNRDGSNTPFTVAETNEKVNAVAVQMDGSVIIAGSFTRVNTRERNQIARLSPTGQLDKTFNPGAGAGLGGTINSIALQSNGRVVIVGKFNSFAGYEHRNIARLNTNGSVDLSFNPWGSDGEIFAVAIQPDGKIVVAGEFLHMNGASMCRIARLNPDGSNVSGFFPEMGFASVYKSLSLQADGKIIAAGFYVSNQGHARVVRLNPDGSLDRRFETIPADTPVLLGKQVYGIALQTDGKVLAGGDFDEIGDCSRRALARFSNPDAALQSLTVDPGGDAIMWRIAGSYPQPYRVMFEGSSDGVTWNWLGYGAPIPGVGFRLNHTNLPTGMIHYVRATGWSSCGYCNGSTSIQQSTVQFYSRGVNASRDWACYE